MKRLMTVLCAVCLISGMLVFSGCSIAGLADKDKIGIELGMTVDSGLNKGDSAAVVLTNNGDKAVSYIEIKITPYDENDEKVVLGEDDPASEYMSGNAEAITFFNDPIMPGESQASVFSISEICGLSKAPDHFTVDISRLEWKDMDKVEKLISLSDVKYNSGSAHATVTMRNDTEYEYDFNDLMSGRDLWVDAVCRDADGNIIGGDTALVEYMPAQSEKEITVYFTGDISYLSPAKVDFYPGHYELSEEELKTLEVEEE